jgi:hypothetical protein
VWYIRATLWFASDLRLCGGGGVESLPSIHTFAASMLQGPLAALRLGSSRTIAQSDASNAPGGQALPLDCRLLVFINASMKHARTEASCKTAANRPGRKSMVRYLVYAERLHNWVKVSTAACLSCNIGRDPRSLWTFSC